MKLNPQIYREYDIRGVAGTDYDEEFAFALGRAYGSKLLDQGISRAAVGRDCRVTSPAFHAAMKNALRATGIDVVDVGLCPTPLLYFAVHHLDLEAGIQITGSHNPPDHNGFKIVIGKTTIHGGDIKDLARRIEEGQFREGAGSEESYPIVAAYQGFLSEHFGRCGQGVKVVVDSGNGTAGPVAPGVYRGMGCEVIDLYSEPDGRFPNHHADPTVEENVGELIAKVRETGADLGIAFDGDADRIGVVDETGRIIWGDEMLVVFARDILARRPGATVVSEVKCSQRLYDDIEANGGVGIMWKAGHSLLKAKMRETGAVLGGEMSGHLFFADRYFGFDDAIYAGARMIEILARGGKRLAEILSDLPHAVYTPEIRVDCPDDVKFKVAAAAQARFREMGYPIVDVDGVRVKFEKGWGLVRASNTQPILVLRFEAADEESLRQYEALVRTELRRLGSGLEAAGFCPPG
ncbi:MAG TPA: phosphomannomutase/phosphoglucomutase [Candidatus Limnocylindrales bacterium]|nr:phosphomannomutase/phosphoglucomutase [Candidatus Limnocylindrales bacterium]